MDCALERILSQEISDFQQVILDHDFLIWKQKELYGLPHWLDLFFRGLKSTWPLPKLLRDD